MTTETRTVTVGSVARKSGETNGRKWVRYSLLDDRDKFVGSTFDKAIGDALENFDGDTIEVDLEVKQGEKGNLYDLKAVRLASPPPIAAINPAERDTRITRSVALKAAVDFAAQEGGHNSVDTVLIVANAFDAWLRGEEKGSNDSEIPF